MTETWDSLVQNFESMKPAPYLGLVMVAAVASQWLGWKLKVPSILLLLGVGFGLGRLADPEVVLGQGILFGGVTIAVGIILFEGSLSLSVGALRELSTPVLRLCTVTVAVAWVLITAAALLVGFEVEVALLVGAILVVTGPTVIAPILRQLRPTRRVASMLRWEGIVVDPIGAVLAVLVFQGVLAGRVEAAVTQVLWSLAATVLIGFGIALSLGWVLARLMRANAIPDFLHGVVFLSSAVGALVASNALQPESGLLTVTVLGVYLGSQSDLHLEHVVEFKEHLQVLFVGALFVVLAGRVAPSDIAEVAPRAAVFVLLLLLIRPVSIYLGLWGTSATKEERSLLACMAPRGIVAAAVTSIFALEFEHSAEVAVEAGNFVRAAELQKLAAQVSELVPLVFLVIVATVAIYGLGVGRLAERLGLATTSPQGVLFVGSRRWVVEVAATLEKADITCLVVDRDYAALSGARMAGVKSEAANILSDYAVRDMELAGIGRLIACTSDDEANATAAREFAHVLGRANVYQLQRSGDEPEALPDRRRGTAGHLTATASFSPARSYEAMEDLEDRGAVAKKTRLTEEFPLSAFRERYGEEAVIMFVLDDGKLAVVTPDYEIPETGVSVVALVIGPEEPPSSDA